MRVCIVAIALLIAGCINPETARPNPGQIDGAVLDWQAMPVANVTVRVMGTDLTGVSGELGGFSIYNVPEGNYTLQAFIDGQEIRKNKTVQGGHITRVIMQQMPDHGDSMAISSLSHEVRALALPNTPCGACTWEESFTFSPDSLVLQADWSDALDGMLHFEVYNGEDALVKQVSSRASLWTSIPTDAFQENPVVRVEVQFGPEVIPHPDFRLDMTLNAHYS